MRPGRGARLENSVPPLRCVSRVGTVHRHRCLHTTRWGALGHTASEPRATFLLAGPGGSLSLRWSDSGVSGGRCTATHCGGADTQSPCTCHSWVWRAGVRWVSALGAGASADRCPLWSQITKLKTDGAMGAGSGGDLSLRPNGGDRAAPRQGRVGDGKAGGE